MDWSKAKNVLIIAFIITNIFLIYNIQRNAFNKEALSENNANKVEEVVDILEKRNIKVEAAVPVEMAELPLLEVEYIIYDTEEMEQLFFYDNSSESYINEQLTFTSNNKVLHYERNLEGMSSGIINEKQARQEAERFLENYGFMGNDVIYWNSSVTDEQYEILFKQKHKGRILEHSYMICTVSEFGVIAFERMWLRPLEFGNIKMEIFPAAKGLLKFMDEYGGYTEAVITNISLVYWLDLSKNDFTDLENIESGTAIPAWRIELKNGETSFIPAFSNY